MWCLRDNGLYKTLEVRNQRSCFQESNPRSTTKFFELTEEASGKPITLHPGGDIDHVYVLHDSAGAG